MTLFVFSLVITCRQLFVPSALSDRGARAVRRLLLYYLIDVELSRAYSAKRRKASVVGRQQQPLGQRFARLFGVR